MDSSDLDPRLASSRLYSDVPRLEQQAALSWPTEVRVLTRLGLSDGMRVLDLGCGPGFVTEQLLKLLPSSPVVAVDLDPKMTALTAALTQGGFAERSLVLTCSATNVDLDDECLDFAIARFVFQHLPAPDLAAREVHRLLQAGGQLAVIDIDEGIGGIVDPAMPSLAIIGAKVGQLQASRGGNRNIGRELWRVLRHAGFEDVAVDPILVHSDDAGIERFLPHYQPDRYRPFLAAGAITQAEFDAYRKDFDAFLAASYRYIAHLLLVVSGRKG